mgnify:CR=1 FL=1
MDYRNNIPLKIILLMLLFNIIHYTVYSQKFVSNKRVHSYEEGINYFGEDKRPFMVCEQYNEFEIDSLQDVFCQVMENAKTTREKAVTAANFLVTLPHVIPYAYESHCEGYELAWKYTRKGLFLKNIVENGRLYPAWGCDILSSKLPLERKETLTNLGDTYKVGFHCSSFIRWCLYNADAVTKNILEGSWANDFGKFPGSKQIPLKDGLQQIRPGDLLYFPVDERNGHIAIVIGFKNETVTFIESALWGGDHTDSRNGLRWRTFNKKTTDFETYRFKWLIQMSDVYGD